jgi:uncharacterized membrane protein HdeD (DUF308 family)
MSNELEKIKLQDPELQAIGSQIWEHIKRNSGWAIGIGALLVFLGVLALLTPIMTGVSVSIMVGVLLAVGGVSQLVFAAKAGHQLWPYVMGALSIGAGIYMASHPVVAVGTLTVILAFFLFTIGFCEIMMGWQVRPAKGWVMTMVSGFLSLALGVMIWGQFPVTGALAIGVLFGIKLLLSGMTLIALGSAARKALKEADQAVASSQQKTTV